MRSHAATHEKVRPYVCDHCDKKFSRKSGLKKHLKQVHNIYSYDLNQVNAYLQDSFSELARMAGQNGQNVQNGQNSQNMSSANRQISVPNIHVTAAAQVPVIPSVPTSSVPLNVAPISIPQISSNLLNLPTLPNNQAQLTSLLYEQLLRK